MEMTLRLDTDHDAALTMLAKAQGLSKHEAALRAILNEAARTTHTESVAASSARVRERYADLIRRLGE